MAFSRLLLASLLVLAGCGGNPLRTTPGSGGTPGTGGAITVDPKLAKDLKAVTYAGGALTIDLTGLISSSKPTTFTRAPSRDIASGIAGQPDYLAFTYQETGMQRAFLALVATNARGNLVSVATADGGQFNTHQSGMRYWRSGDYSAPTLGSGAEQGLFSYAGRYVGIFVPGPGTDPTKPGAFQAGVPLTVQGDIQINASFRDNLIDGAITNRQLFGLNGARITSMTIKDNALDLTDPEDFPQLVLSKTAIAANGTFLGSVEYLGEPGQTKGDYGGAFGGVGASDVAGVLWVNPVPSEEGLWEYGTFNLPRCDLAGASALCLPR